MEYFLKGIVFYVCLFGSDQPHVRWVLPDSYLDVKNKTYAGNYRFSLNSCPYSVFSLLYWSHVAFLVVQS